MHTTTTWKKNVRELSRLYNLTRDEKKRVEKSPVAKLINALPYLAGCESPRQTAINHLGIYLTAHKNPVFDMKPGESTATRMFDGTNFRGGNRTVIKKSMKILELMSLEDHHTDREKDALNGKYNPINTGDLDYKTERDRLIAEISALNCPEVDRQIFGGKDTVAKGAFVTQSIFDHDFEGALLFQNVVDPGYLDPLSADTWL